MTASCRLQAVGDISAASWLAAGVGSFGSGVRSLLPEDFEAYARILHPAWVDETPVRWSQVAAWSGKVIHPRVQFDAVAHAPSAAPRPSRPWKNAPAKGNMPAEVLRHLCGILGDYTRSAVLCWFCLWDGYGWVNNSATATAHASNPLADSTGAAAHQSTDNLGLTVPPVFTEEILRGPRVSLPKRSYFLFQGPLDAATELGWLLDGGFFIPQSPNLFWPDDHSWCVATEIDLDSSYLGGPEALAQRLSADRFLEVLSVTPSDPIDSGSDEINRLQQECAQARDT